jgi:peptidoglycan/xylan/chitin deacetylase (PgdA/CDA1 family)
MTSCYLTIDDSPSSHTDEMIDYLVDKKIPALLFVRGDLLEGNPAPIIRAIKHGFVIGNHSYAHKPFGEYTYEQAIDDIEKCDRLIDQAYEKSSIKRPGKYFRSPYLDRGDGDRIERHFEQSSNIDINADERVIKIQNYLCDNGFTQPFKTNHPLYQNQSIASAADCLMTYSSFDWMLTKRHVGKWDYKNIDDLKHRIDESDMKKFDGNITIFHDQEETFDTFKSLIDHMIIKGYKFLDFQ